MSPHSGNSPLLTALRADYAVNTSWDSKLTVTIWRTGQWLNRRPGLAAFFGRRLVQGLDVLWTRGYVGADLPFNSAVGPGLRLPHAGRGVVVYPGVCIGSGVTIYHQVTLGVRYAEDAPTVGDRVAIGAGAKILGEVTLGNGSKIGANAVVLTDVAEGATAVGVPARVIEP